MFKFWTTLTIRPKFRKPPTKFSMINWPTDSNQECKRKMIPKRNKISTWKTIPIAQFALQRWTRTLKHCKDVKHAKNISILNAFRRGKSTTQHVHYAEASSPLVLRTRTTLSASFKEFISKLRKIKINDFHLSIIFLVMNQNSNNLINWAGKILIVYSRIEQILTIVNFVNQMITQLINTLFHNSLNTRNS